MYNVHCTYYIYVVINVYYTYLGLQWYAAKSYNNTL